MSREVHVRFCERPRVRFPRATYPKLLGPQKWTYYHLYVVLDVFSRYVVAWRLETRESAALAEDLFSGAIVREGVDPTQLTVHADGGSAMTSKNLTYLFADLGVTKSRSRPHVSNDNPYSESHFKTLKYGSSYPGRFANIEQAQRLLPSIHRLVQHRASARWDRPANARRRASRPRRRPAQRSPRCSSLGLR